MVCKARQYSDQMSCVCGLAWDKGDPNPPECRGIPQTQKAVIQPKKVIKVSATQTSSKPGTDYISDLMRLLDE